VVLVNPAAPGVFLVQSGRFLLYKIHLRVEFLLKTDTPVVGIARYFEFGVKYLAPYLSFGAIYLEFGAICLNFGSKT